METSAPSLGKILSMVLFALSCVGLLIFLWVEFGGTIPLNPQGYRFEASFPYAQQLATPADVRIAGVSVGKVVGTSLDAQGNRTIATIQLSNQFAPIRKDATAILRTKTILGETYVELSPGQPNAPPLPDGAMLPRAQVVQAVQLDDVEHPVAAVHVAPDLLERRLTLGDAAVAVHRLERLALVEQDHAQVIRTTETDIAGVPVGPKGPEQPGEVDEGRFQTLVVCPACRERVHHVIALAPRCAQRLRPGRLTRSGFRCGRRGGTRSGGRCRSVSPVAFTPTGSGFADRGGLCRRRHRHVGLGRRPGGKRRIRGGG